MHEREMTIETLSRDRMIRRAVADYFAALRAMEARTWVYAFARDAVADDPSEPEPVRGEIALGSWLERLWEPFEELSVGEDLVSVDAGGAAVKWTGRGLGVSGREVTFEGIDVFDVDGRGKIRRVRRFWDPTRVMAVLAG